MGVKRAEYLKITLVSDVMACNDSDSSHISKVLAAALDEINEGEEECWFELWRKVPGAGLVFPWHLKGIDELQRRFEHWNQNNQEMLKNAYNGHGFTSLDWTSLFGNIPQFNPRDYEGTIPIGCYEMWCDKIDRQYDRHQARGDTRIKVNTQNYEHDWVSYFPEDGSNTEGRGFYFTRDLLKEVVQHRLTL